MKTPPSAILMTIPQRLPFAPMLLTRSRNGAIEPPLDDAWPPFVQLLWYAGEALMNSGGTVAVAMADSGRYVCHVEGGRCVSLTFDGVRGFLRGFALGRDTSAPEQQPRDAPPHTYLRQVHVQGSQVPANWYSDACSCGWSSGTRHLSPGSAEKSWEEHSQA